jgi:hypothetical protein
MKVSNLTARMQGVAGSLGWMFLWPPPQETDKPGIYSTKWKRHKVKINRQPLKPVEREKNV